jgi:hypothetical protein
MPIRLIVNNDCAFGPDQIEVLVTAFEDTLKMLGLVDRDHPATLMVAQRIVELAKQGERDPVRLRECAMQTFAKQVTRPQVLATKTSGLRSDLILRS